MSIDDTQSSGSSTVRSKDTFQVLAALTFLPRRQSVERYCHMHVRLCLHGNTRGGAYFTTYSWISTLICCSVMRLVLFILH